MPFRFKMQKVLDYREQLEEEAKVNLAVQQARLAEAHERLEQIRQELHQAEDGLMNAALMDAPERWLREQYVKGLRADAATKPSRCACWNSWPKRPANCLPRAP